MATISIISMALTAIIMFVAGLVVYNSYSKTKKDVYL